MFYMFRTVLVHYQEQLYKLYIAFGICRYHTSVCCVAIATQQTDVPAYTGIYDVQLIKLFLKTYCCSPKHVEHLTVDKV